MKLSLCVPAFYRVKKGQTLEEIALTFGMPPRVLAAANHLDSPPEEGQVLTIPKERGNLYTVKGGESMTLLCGSKENFIAKNRTRHLYPLQTVWL